MFIKGVFSPHFFSKKFGFWSIILQNGTKYHVNFFGKKVVIFHFGFWLQEAKKNPKMSLKRLHDNNKFCILDGTKHNPKNFGILHFITPK